jgi:hypothetical protein
VSGGRIYCVCIVDGSTRWYEVNDANECRSYEADLRTMYDNVVCNPTFPA